MKAIKIILFIVIVAIPFFPAKAVNLKKGLLGRILLQVEEKGEAWYLEPVERKAIFLGRPKDAFEVMRSKGLGVSNQDFNSYLGQAPQKLSGRILLQVEEKGEAWYVNPVDLKMHYLGRPIDAFGIMRSLGLGITNDDFSKLNKNGYFVEYKVGFTPQAPFGEWSDERQQEGCEEASAFMVVKWARGETFSLTEARDEILKISDIEKEKYGQYIDTSASDTLTRILNGYFNFYNAELIKDVSKQLLVDELREEKIIIMPSNGRKLQNPNFTSPGPLIHMLVIKGYDEDTGEFITNDPGTRKGESYRYDEDILFNALSDYVTGEHELTEKKNIIAVSLKK